MSEVNRVLKYKQVNSAESLQNQILKSLKLLNNNITFNERIDGYFKRQPNLKIELELNFESIKKTIKEKISQQVKSRPIPENYEMSNPLNRWNISVDSRNPDEIEQDNNTIEKRFCIELDKFARLVTFLENYFVILEKKK